MPVSVVNENYVFQEMNQISSLFRALMVYPIHIMQLHVLIEVYFVLCHVLYIQSILTFFFVTCWEQPARFKANCTGASLGVLAYDSRGGLSCVQ